VNVFELAKEWSDEKGPRQAKKDALAMCEQAKRTETAKTVSDWMDVVAILEGLA